MAVEDDRETCGIIGAALETTATIALVSSATEARRLLAESGEGFDLALVSYGATDRPALVTTLRRRRPYVPVIALVTADDPILRPGVSQVVRKPLAADELRRAVARALPMRARAYRPPIGVARVLAFLAEHVSQHVSLLSLAHLAAMSRSHLSRTFRMTVGMPLREYVHELRLERARHLMLARRRATLTEVAIEAGFYDLPHFDKSFRGRFGVTPSEFMRRHERTAVSDRLRRRPRV
jgi:AraC-like DNA-binding protein